MRTFSPCLALAVAAVCVACTGTSPDPGSASCSPSCAGGLTCVDNADFPGGVCTARCSNGTGCPSGSACLQLSTGEYCAPACGSDDRCPTGLVCGNGGAAGRVCLVPAAAPATGVSCPAAPAVSSGGTINVAEFQGCVQPIVQSTLPRDAGSVLSLGVHGVGETVQFQLPAGTSGFTVVSQGQSSNVSNVNAFGNVQPNTPVPTPITGPGGTFYDLPTSFDLAPSDRSLLFAPISPVTAAITFPNSTAGLLQAARGLAPGGWTLTVSDLLHECKALGCGDPASGSTGNHYDVTVLTRSGAIPDRGGLDLAIYLVTGTVSAAAAPTDPHFTRMLQRVRDDFARAGVCLQTVTYYDVPAWARARWPTVQVSEGIATEPCSEYRQLFTLARPGNALSLFLVGELIDPSGLPGQRLVGFDGAIPGVSTFNGTIAGGAIASAADLTSDTGCGGGFSTNCGADVVGETVAHEAAHALGLFHTSEADGASGDEFDPLTDTPQCVCSLCVPAAARSGCADQQQSPSTSTTQVDGTSCSQGTQDCGGADYLMFWTVTDRSAGNLSPQEGQVMRMNPLVRPL